MFEDSFQIARSVDLINVKSKKLIQNYIETEHFQTNILLNSSNSLMSKYS